MSDKGSVTTYGVEGEGRWARAISHDGAVRIVGFDGWLITDEVTVTGESMAVIVAATLAALVPSVTR